MHGCGPCAQFAVATISSAASRYQTVIPPMSSQVPPLKMAPYSVQIVSILSRMARVNSWVVDSPPMSRVRYLPSAMTA